MHVRSIGCAATRSQSQGSCSGRVDKVTVVEPKDFDISVVVVEAAAEEVVYSVEDGTYSKISIMTLLDYIQGWGR